MRELPAAGRVATRWLNGAGSTVEVARDGGDDFRWRISIATVGGGTEFSRYPGVDRMLVPLSAAGLSLEVDGERVHVACGDVLRFAGEQAVRSLPGDPLPGDGPSDDLNLMVRRGVVEGSLTVEAFDAGTTIPAGSGVAVLVLLRGSATWGAGTHGPRDALLLESGESVVLHGAGTVALARLSRVGP